MLKSISFAQQLITFYKIYLLITITMQASSAIHSVCKTIDIVLQKGAEKLYEKYITHKLPQHAHHQNNSTLYNNLNLNEVAQPIKVKIQNIPITTINQVPIDNRAPKRISVKKQNSELSTLSPKNTTFGKSTKYQTIVNSQRSSIEKHLNAQNISDSFNLLEQNQITSPIVLSKQRPMTIQTGRQKHRQNNLLLDSKLEEVEEKRAATCHTRRRKAIVYSKDKQQKLVKVNEDIPKHIIQEIQTANRFRRYKRDQQQQENEKAHEIAKLDAYMRMKDKRTKQNFEQLKKKLKGKFRQAPPLTNVQTDNGKITINGQPKQPPKTHIIQLQFNPQEQKLTKTIQSKVGGVNGTKKSSFVSKLKKKMKISNDEFTNGGERQISSIPFLNLNYGIILSQSTIQATASRRRPVQEISRLQFNSQNSSHRFKSHIPIVNSSNINIFASIEEEANKTGRSSFFQNHESAEKRQFQTTLQSKKQMEGSILWRNRGKSQNKHIRISNLEAFNHQILDMKVAH